MILAEAVLEIEAVGGIVSHRKSIYVNSWSRCAGNRARTCRQGASCWSTGWTGRL
jgi:hypothetical protein